VINTTKLFSRREGFPAGKQNISTRPWLNVTFQGKTGEFSPEGKEAYE